MKPPSTGISERTRRFRDKDVPVLPDSHSAFNKDFTSYHIAFSNVTAWKHIFAWNNKISFFKGFSWISDPQVKDQFSILIFPEAFLCIKL
jgi:hypothetical protein